jgi:hypothetical protein
VGKLKTWFVFDMKIIQTKTMENVKFQRPEMQLKDCQAIGRCESWNFLPLRVRVTWYYPHLVPQKSQIKPTSEQMKPSQIKPASEQTKSSQVEPTREQTKSLLSPLWLGLTCCVPKSSLKVWEMGKSFHPIRFKDFKELNGDFAQP